ncbi:MAG: hypothetical protein KF715_19605 [Candidatus Didemnitutus sp.]|nr:hypothetical protein [Candidatus Didemnitutus sp.]
MKKHLLILIEDEEDYARSLPAQLRLKNVDCEVVTDTQFGNVEPATIDAFVSRTLELIKRHRSRCPVILLDLGLHKTLPNAWDLGFHVGKAVRESFYELPIMVLTSHQEQSAEGYLHDFDAFENKSQFASRTPTEIEGLLTRTADKRRTLIRNLPKYYKQHVQLNGAELGITSFTAYGHYFTGESQNLEQVLDNTAKITEHLTKNPRLTVIFFADLAGSTKLKMEHGFVEGLRIVRTHNQVITNIIADTGGVVVKYIGDAVMARYDFDLSKGEQVDLRAVNAAIQIQEKFHELNRADPNGHHIQTKIGIDIGRVADFYGNDPHGSAVDRAARIQSHAKAGQILVSGELIQLSGIQGKLQSRAGHVYRLEPKDYLSKVIPLECSGFAEKVDVHEIHWNYSAAKQS